MALRLRTSQNYIGVYFVQKLSKWRAQSGTNTKRVIGDFPTEVEAAQAYNRFVKARDEFNGGFLLSRVNDLREEQV
jgi:AP2 domain